jgi:hypothetical protein
MWEAERKAWAGCGLRLGTQRGDTAAKCDSLLVDAVTQPRNVSTLLGTTQGEEEQLWLGLTWLRQAPGDFRLSTSLARWAIPVDENKGGRR